MNISFEALEQFINDFNLTIENGIIAFSAILHIRLNGQLQVITSDVQVITSDNLGTIYLLGLDKNEGYVPDMFEAKKNLFSYTKGTGLKITGASDAGNFIISVSPK
ncbi:MAG: hypothetical protein ABIP30_17450 [Ferruginibacter sp.]